MPAQIDPVLRRITREKNKAWFATNGKRAFPYLCFILGYDEPMGYAKFEAFSRTPHGNDGAAEALDAVDADVRTKFGFGRYGLPDYFAPENASSNGGPYQRIAFLRWWNAQLAAESRGDTALIHEIAPGVPYIPSSFCFMYNLNFIDVAQHAAYSDIVSADPYPTATLAYYGRERSRDLLRRAAVRGFQTRAATRGVGRVLSRPGAPGKRTDRPADLECHDSGQRR